MMIPCPGLPAKSGYRGVDRSNARIHGTSWHALRRLAVDRPPIFDDHRENHFPDSNVNPVEQHLGVKSNLERELREQSKWGSHRQGQRSPELTLFAKAPYASLIMPRARWYSSISMFSA
jgi:hypothetical protein